MADDRVKCKDEGCNNQIQPATAKRNDGYCGPCHARRVKEKQDEYNRKNVKGLNLYEGMTDPVEMIRIMFEPRKHDPLIKLAPCPRSCEELFLQLDESQAKRVMGLAAEFMGKGDPWADAAEEIARSLGAFTDYSLDEMLGEYVDGPSIWKKRFTTRVRRWPEIAFRNSGEGIAKKLMDGMPSDAKEAMHALKCLSWIGSEGVVDYFSDSSRWPGVKSRAYTHCAGWEVRDGKRFNLYSPDCYGLTTGEEGEANDPAVAIMTGGGEACPRCKSALYDLLKIDLKDPRFHFIPKISNALAMRYCESCACDCECHHLYVQQDENGRCRWIDVEPLSESEKAYKPLDFFDWGIGVENLSPRRAHHAADLNLPTAFSQIGGIPAWAHEPEFPACRVCGKTMMCIGQVDAGLTNGEGMYYAFLCPQCRVTTVGYQGH